MWERWYLYHPQILKNLNSFEGEGLVLIKCTQKNSFKQFQPKGIACVCVWSVQQDQWPNTEYSSDLVVEEFKMMKKATFWVGKLPDKVRGLVSNWRHTTCLARLAPLENPHMNNVFKKKQQAMHHKYPKIGTCSSELTPFL